MISENDWHTAPNELPTTDTICLTRYNGGYHINVWNQFYQCWDDEDGDDSMFDCNKELEWVGIEKI